MSTHSNPQRIFFPGQGPSSFSSVWVSGPGADEDEGLELFKFFEFVELFPVSAGESSLFWGSWLDLGASVVAVEDNVVGEELCSSSSPGPK